MDDGVYQPLTHNKTKIDSFFVINLLIRIRFINIRDENVEIQYKSRDSSTGVTGTRGLVL